MLAVKKEPMTIAGSSSTLANYTRLILLAVASTTPVGRSDFSFAALCDTVDVPDTAEINLSSNYCMEPQRIISVMCVCA